MADSVATAGAAQPTTGSLGAAAQPMNAAREAAVAPVRISAGSGVATLRLDASYRLRVVDGIVSGLHVPGESHFDLLGAFAPPQRLARAIELAAQHGLSSHELGDACLIV